MTSVQENKNELEAAVRYCESAISRAKATIESMEFRQQAASKAWHEQTGREAALEREVADLKVENTRLNDRLMISVKEVGDLQSEVDELAKAYKDELHETNVWKKAHQEQRELVALRDDQIAMLERRLAKHTGEKVYPFKEGDIYYVFNQLDGTWIESVWDDESERIHDTRSLPDHPHKVYFTVDQKNVLDKFKPEDD